MRPIYIEGVLIGNEITNILIESNHIAGIGTALPMPANALYLDGHNKAAFPSFANMHTHSAMSLFRGYANDLPLMTWLNDKIWPKEKLLDDDLVYWGVRLACTEMIKSGTTLFSDMYFRLPAAAKAVAEIGMRCMLGINIFGDAEEVTDRMIEELLGQFESYDGMVSLAIAPHSIYTVSGKGLRRCAEYCNKYGLLFNIHMSETESEVNQCLAEHGCRPYEWLEKLGVMDLTEGRFTGAHSLHLDEKEIALIGKHHGSVVHNPCSNLKLGSGHFFPYTELRDAGACVTLGTDGCCSSNNLDMIEAARLMSYLQKGVRKDPTTLPADELLEIATYNGFRALGLPGGKLEAGNLADLILIDLNNIAFIPNNDSLANLFYAAHGDAVDTIICNGRILMQQRQIASESETIAEARRAAHKLIN